MGGASQEKVLHFMRHGTAQLRTNSPLKDVHIFKHGERHRVTLEACAHGGCITDSMTYSQGCPTVQGKLR